MKLAQNNSSPRSETQNSEHKCNLEPAAVASMPMTNLQSIEDWRK